MAISGLHLLVTYKCNARCRHCFLFAGPERSGIMSSDFALRLVREAADIPRLDHIFIEGGEPFLYPNLMLDIVKAADEHGLWVGALSNGFWAVSADRARDVLAPLAAAGLKSLSVSTDAWHQEFVPRDRPLMAAEVALELGIDTDVMVCGPADGSQRAMAQHEVEVIEAALSSVSVSSGGVRCRGRAATTMLDDGQESWNTLTQCRESLTRPGRVHVGPNGEVHLCQGLLLGERAEARSLAQVLSGYAAGDHPLAARLSAGGPAELARFAQSFGWRPRGLYGDSCDLCFDVRAHLRSRFPHLIGPPEMFGAA